jgi:dTDP-4-dehydrorhamnose 3,5-epimerase
VKFLATKLAGVVAIRGGRVEDERGFFAPIFLASEFASHGIQLRVAETAIAFNAKKGTLRGMHYQVPPSEQAKLVRCIRGAVHDVALDLRPGSRTLREWVAVELTAAGDMLYIPGGFAHGYLTLADDTEVLYHLSKGRDPSAERGVRWDDPAFQIQWPLRPAVIAIRDGSFPDWSANQDPHE